MPPVLASALDLAARGIPVFPCLPSKAPACPGGFKAATADPAAVRELWRSHPGPLIGVPTGEVSGFDVLDIDSPRHPEAAEWWIEAQTHIDPTRLHRTRSGGRHVLFRHMPGLRCWTGKPVTGIDGRADGGYIVWWPALGAPVDCADELVPWPNWLLRQVVPLEPAVRRWVPPSLSSRDSTGRYATAALRHAAERVAYAPEGQRNEILNTEAFAMGRFITAGLLDAQQVADALAAAALAACLTEREVAATLASALRAGGLP
jgi:Bifunctional DNA primase/polymerase, N-terminal